MCIEGTSTTYQLQEKKMSAKKVELTPKYMSRLQAAHYITSKYGIHCSALSLEKWASIGCSRGPKYTKFGRRVFHEVADLDLWVESGMSRKFSSTSDEGRGS
jgi:hypothetical protein